MASIEVFFILAVICVTVGGLAVLVAKEFDYVRGQVAEVKRLLKEITERN